MNQPTLDATTVRHAAKGRWQSILPALNIVTPNHPKKHGSCPTCGGKDRFRFDDQNGNGSWYCNQCNPHASDGLALVMRSLGLSFPETLTTVASVLGLDSAQYSRPRPPLPPAPVRIDWRAMAFACELAAVDRRLRASRVLTAVPTVAGEDLSDAVRDRLMVAVCSAYADVEQAERLEYLGDALRVSAVMQ